MWAFEHDSYIQPMFQFQTSVLQFLSIPGPFISFFCASEEQNYFYTLFVPAQTNQQVRHSKTNEVVWFVEVLNRLG